MLNSTNLELNFMVNSTELILDAFESVREFIPDDMKDIGGNVMLEGVYTTNTWFGDNTIQARVRNDSIDIAWSTDHNYKRLFSFSNYKDESLRYRYASRINLSTDSRMMRDKRDHKFYRVINSNNILVELPVRDFNPNEIDGLDFQYLTMYDESTAGLILYDSYVYSIMNDHVPDIYRVLNPVNISVPLDDMYEAIAKVCTEIKDDHFVGTDL